MKKLVLFLLLSFPVFAFQAQSLEEKLTALFLEFDTTQVFSAKMAASSKLELLANMESENYAVNYYAAYAKAMISYMEKDKDRKDMFLDVADSFLEKVKQLQPKNEETFILGALLANARLVVDGGSRWKQQGDIFNANIDAAIAINPANPRIYHLKGVATYFTPKMFGGGSKNALEYLEKAKAMFVNQVNGNITVPYWGEKRNLYFISECTK
jgi:hypothetical protein